MTARDVLLAAADRIEIRGHCQGASEIDGRCCVIGALDRTTSDPALYNKATAMLCRYIGAPADHWFARIVTWNDAPGRTAAEVISALRGAAGGAS